MKRAFTYQEASYFFNIEPDLASSIFKTMLQFVYCKFHENRGEMFTKLEDIVKPLPKIFRCRLLRKVRGLMDCTEIRVESPRNYEEAGDSYR